jgi:glutathione synthase/RimK-type ligase-like ATP-grasp enzyme
MKLKIAGISRQAEYSPNHVENDSLILRATAEVLQELDVEVIFYGEGEVLNSNFNEELIFSMAQGPEAIERLLEIEKRGSFIINSPRAVKNCYRINMVKLLPENGIPFPKSIEVKIDSDLEINLNGFDPHKFWIKRGDVHAVHREDVTLVYSKEENKSVMKEFYRRGIKIVIIQEHLEGDVIKFYSVRNSGFFNWYYLNGKYHTKFDLDKLIELASSSADILGLDVYGGDAIVSPDGSISIIDMNDWPSFAPVRDEAKKHIANLIYKMAVKYVEN